MELIVRLRCVDTTTGVGGGRSPVAGPVDVIVEVEAGHRISDLVAVIVDGAPGRGPADDCMWRLGLRRTGSVLAGDASVSESGIVSGDELLVAANLDSLERALASDRPVPTAGRLLACVDVLAGPDAGTSRTLSEGRYSIGRDRSCDVVLTDPTVSKVHLHIQIGVDGLASMCPRSTSSNPVRVNDNVVTEGTTVGPDDVVTVGGTRLAVRPLPGTPFERFDQLGQIEFQRTPYRPPVVSRRAAPLLGNVPVRRDGRRFQLMSALAPIAAGLTFFAFSRQPQFLIITLMSPLALLAGLVEDRRSGRRTFSSESAAFADRLVGWRAEIDVALEAERVERLRAAPDIALLARRAKTRSVDLWARGRCAPDFLALRVGLGDVRPLFEPSPGDEGDSDLLETARQAIAGTELIADAPITADLAAIGVLGVHGQRDLVDGIASSLAIQAACLHSPEDLVIAAALHRTRPAAGWLKWLPHVRSIVSPLGGNHVVIGDAAARSLIGRLIEVAADRVGGTERAGGAAGEMDRRWPWMLVVLDAMLDTDHADVARLLDLCPLAGVSVVWLAADAADVPRQAAAVVVATQGRGHSALGTVWSTDPTIASVDIEVEQLRADVGDRIARSLAPLRDASTASQASSIPRAAPLLDVLGVGAPTAAWVADNWSRSTSYDLTFPIGMGAAGLLTLDLVEDGPHTLIGGTSGAGKSELMQSIVSSLAAHHSPRRLNFLFVDYKGGASSNVFGSLPHTVGYVTNLSADLAARALTSLRAELTRRMQVMEGRAKDMAEMLERHPDDAPPSLVIVVDEFATLVKEVPDFVAGIVDIAQRGRSLGIHLILATQRPSGSVNENILANTNLRISLRMLDRTDSTSVIGSPDAAEIPVPLKGRAFARLGPRSLVSFQGAFCGAPFGDDDAESPVLIARYDTPVDSPRTVDGGRGSSPSGLSTHLDVVLSAVSEAAELMQVPEPRRPWREVLPEVVLLDVVLDAVLDDERAASTRQHPGRLVAMGMLDAPERQDQSPAIVDLETGGGLLIFGSGGSGKTTALRTLAASASLTAAAGCVDIVGLDFASRGLASIAPLPTVVDVAAGDDLEAVTRHLATLEVEMRRRRGLLSAVHAEDLTAYNERHEALSRVLVLVDGFGGFTSSFVGPGSAGTMSSIVPMDRWVDTLSDLAVEGRQVGMHVVITADRRSAVPSRLHSAISNRLILRHADEQGYGEHGISTVRSKGLTLSGGRGFWQADATVQIALVSADAGAEEQGRALQDMAATLAAPGVRPPRSVVASTALPDHVPIDHPVERCRYRFVLGQEDRTGASATIDLQWSNFVVAGAGRSGRSTTLNTCAAGLARTHQLWGIGQRSSGLDQSLLDDGVFGRGADIPRFVDRLKHAVATGDTDRPHVLLVDDLDAFDDISLTAAWEQASLLDDVRVIASIETRSLAGYSTNPLLTILKRARRLLLIQPDDAAEVVQVAGVKSPVRPGMKMVAGRGVLVVDREPSVVQVARNRAC